MKHMQLRVMDQLLESSSGLEENTIYNLQLKYLEVPDAGSC